MAEMRHAVPAAVVIAYLFAHGLSAIPYDDSYFFKRFALNALEHGMFAWNVADGPVYGCTSQLFMILATVVTWLVPDHFVVGTKVLNVVCLVAFAVVVTRWCARVTREPADGALIALLAIGTPIVLTTIGTGMETAVALALLAAGLTWMFRPGGGGGTDFGAAVVTVAVYTCRPDAAVIPAAAWGLDALFHRRLPIRFAVFLAVGMATVLAGFRWYYGTAFPLPFYMKTAALSSYGDNVDQLGWLAKRESLALLLVFAAPLLWIAAMARGPRPRALLGAAVVFWAYHAAFTNEIMGFHARFYAPGLVPLVLGAACAWDDVRARRSRRWSLGFLLAWTGLVATARAFEVIPNEDTWFVSMIAWPMYAAPIVTAGWLLLRPPGVRPWVGLVGGGAVLAGATLAWKPPQQVEIRSDAAMLREHVEVIRLFSGVFDVARCLPDLKTAYHSEMGVTGLVLRDARVVDLVGLVSEETALGDKTFEERCQADQPEVIWMPHRNYVLLSREMLRSRCLEEYQPVTGRTASPLLVRRSLVTQFEACRGPSPDAAPPRRQRRRKRGPD